MLLPCAYAYVEYIKVEIATQEEHDFNLHNLQEAATKCNFKFNHEKSILPSLSINIMGYTY